MKYCAGCGQCLSDNCDICPICGDNTFTLEQKDPYDPEKYRHSEMRYTYKKPKATFVLIAINLAVFLMISLLKFAGTDISGLITMQRGAVQGGQVYRVITSIFTHEALFHFLSNSYALYIYGSILEPALGKGKFLFVYFISGILGNVLSFWLIPNPSLGASGAIFGLLGAVAAIYFINPTAVNRAMMRSVVSCVIITTLYSFGGGINNIAHFGGLFGGYMALCIVSKNRGRERLLTSRSLMSLLLIVIMALGIYKGLKREYEPWERQFGDHSFMCFFASFGDYDRAENFADEVLKEGESFYTLDAMAVKAIDGIKKGDSASVDEFIQEMMLLNMKGYYFTDENIGEDFMKFSSLDGQEGIEG